MSEAELRKKVCILEVKVQLAIDTLEAKIEAIKQVGAPHSDFEIAALQGVVNLLKKQNGE